MAQNVLKKLKEIDVIVIDEDTVQFKCLICAQVSCAYYVRKNKYGKGWTLSNFNKHLKTHFQIKEKNRNDTDVPSNSKKLVNSTLLSFLLPNDQNKNSPPNNSCTSLQMVTNEIQNISNQIEIVNSSSQSSSPLLDADPLLNTGIGTDLESKTENTFFVKASSSKEAGSSARSEMPHNIKANEFPKKLRRDENSRTQRNLRIFNRFQENQWKMTDFYKIREEIGRIINERPELQQVFLKEYQFTNKDQVMKKPVAGLLKVLQDTAEQNARVKKFGNRFSESLKLFSLYLFIIGGRLTYETIYGNLKSYLPSLATVERTLNNSQKIKEGDIRFKELKEYLDKRNCPMKIFISDDQTAILKNIRYDSETNQMVGSDKTTSIPLRDIGT